jgi:quinol monooxygenase YgiN
MRWRRQTVHAEPPPGGKEEGQVKSPLHRTFHRQVATKEEQMLLATTTVEDVDRFLEVFSTKGAAKRKEHGSTGAPVFRDPNQDDRVWVIFDWNPEGWQSFVSDPEVPPIIKEAGHKDVPQAAMYSGQYEA